MVVLLYGNTYNYAKLNKSTLGAEESSHVSH